MDFSLPRTGPVVVAYLFSFQGFFFLFNFYSVVLVSAIQQWKSAVITHTSLSWNPPPLPGTSRSSQTQLLKLQSSFSQLSP